MRSFWALWFCIGLVFLVGCEDRSYITRAQVLSNAGHMQVRDDLKWGEYSEVLEPAEPDAHNKLWWQIRYNSGADGLPRIILVDAISGWARLAPDGYRVRLAPAPKVSSDVPLQMSEGSFILVILSEVDADKKQQEAVTSEVTRLNALAENTGLMPLFSLRPARDGRTSLIYGWRENTGITKDNRITEWLTLRTPYRQPVWVNLAPTP